MGPFVLAADVELIQQFREELLILVRTTKVYRSQRHTYRESTHFTGLPGVGIVVPL
jgi:hypothetical protein